MNAARSGVVILHVIPGLGAGGGAERSLAATARHLSECSAQQHVAVLTERQSLVEELESAGVTVHDLSTAGGVIGRVRAIRRLVDEIQPDIVHASLFEADVPTQLAVGRSRPVVVTWTGTPYSKDLRHRSAVPPWKIQLVRLVELVLGRWARTWYQAVTPGVGDENARALRVPGSRVVVGRRGRHAGPPITPEVREHVRGRLAVGDRDPLILCVARHEPEKDLATLLSAIRIVVDSVPAARLMIVGRQGSLTTTLVSAVTELDLHDHVSLLGHRGDVGELLAAADVYVSSSASEGAGGALIEAMAAGLPIVATSTTGMSGVFTDRVDALLVPVGDDRSLAERLVEVLDDEVLARRLGTAAQTTYKRSYTVEDSARALLELYDTVLAGRVR